MKKVLIFTTRQLCYSSGAFFAARINQELENMGVCCEICELEDYGNGVMNSDEIQLSISDSLKLEQYMGMTFDAVIDINSKIPRMIMDDDTYYMDHINAPFYNYIVDNPLYHHSTLSCRLKNYNVILLDKNHCKYVKDNYKHIKKCVFLPLGASEAVTMPYFNDSKFNNINTKSGKYGKVYNEFDDLSELKINDVLFMGTYRNPAEYKNQIDNEKNVNIKNCMISMIEIMRADTSYTMDMALKEILKQDGIVQINSEIKENGIKENNIKENSIIKNDFDDAGCIEYLKSKYSVKTYAELMNRVYLVEMYLRNYHRALLVNGFVGEGIPLRVVGDWWDKYKKIDDGNIVWEKPVTFARSFDIIAKHSVIADSAPFFKMGVHDRVFAGMANKTAVLTDDNKYKQEINNRVNIGSRQSYNLCGVMELYSPGDIKMCVEKAAEMLTNTEYRRCMVDKAYEEYKNHHTWKEVVKELANCIWM